MSSYTPSAMAHRSAHEPVLAAQRRGSTLPVHTSMLARTDLQRDRDYCEYKTGAHVQVHPQHGLHVIYLLPAGNTPTHAEYRHDNAMSSISHPITVPVSELQPVDQQAHGNG